MPGAERGSRRLGWLGEFEQRKAELLGWAFQRAQRNPWLKTRIERRMRQAAAAGRDRLARA